MYKLLNDLYIKWGCHYIDFWLIWYLSFQLFSNRRRVRLFDMDAEDDGEDESLSERSLLDASNGVIAGEEAREDERDSNKENIESPRWLRKDRSDKGRWAIATKKT